MVTPSITPTPSLTPSITATRTASRSRSPPPPSASPSPSSLVFVALEASAGGLFAGPLLLYAWWAAFLPFFALLWRALGRACGRTRTLLMARRARADESTALLAKVDAAAEEALALAEAEARLLAARNSLRALRASAAAAGGDGVPLGARAFLAAVAGAAAAAAAVAGAPALRDAFGGGAAGAPRALRALLGAAEAAARERVAALQRALAAAGRGGSARGARAYRTALLEAALLGGSGGDDSGGTLREIAQRDVVEPWLRGAPVAARAVGDGAALALAAALEHLRLAVWAEGADLHFQWAVEREPQAVPFSGEEHELVGGPDDGGNGGYAGLVEAVGARLQPRDLAGGGPLPPPHGAPLPPLPAKTLVVRV